MRNKFKNAIAKVMAVVMCITNLSVVSSPISVHGAEVGDSIKLTTGEWFNNIYIGFKGDFGDRLDNPSGENYPYGKAIIEYTGEDGNQYPAYCIDNDKWGVESHTNKTYNVSIQKEVDDPKLYAIITNGYPYTNTFDGVTLSNQEAYFATKMALYATTTHSKYDYTGSENWYKNSNVANSENVLNAMKYLHGLGKNATSINKAVVSITASPDIAILDGTNFVQDYEVSANMPYNSFTVSFDGTPLNGATIVDGSGNPKTTFKAGEKFKVVVPKSSVPEDGELKTFGLNISTDVKGQTLLYGTAPTGEMQNYILTGESISTTDSKTTFSAVNGTGTTPDPDPEPNGSGLKIVKLEAGTLTPLAGAEFKLVDQNKGVIGHFYSNSNGEVHLPEMPNGTYYVEEITPPIGYQLDLNSHKDFIIDGTVETVVVTFENHKENELEIIKVDKDTNQSLSGATFNIEGVDNSFKTSVTTIGGSARITGLEDGVYKVTEVIAPEGYILNSEPQIITLKNGEIATLTFENQHKYGLLIRKIDAKTGFPLNGATFRIEAKNGGYAEEFITSNDGTILLEGLEQGWYTVTEINPPEGYLLNEESKDVYLEMQKVNDVVFANEKEPEIKITKHDLKDGSLLAGAEFSIVNLDTGEVIYEGMTDENGQIHLTGLDVGNYEITEIAPPKNYIGVTESRVIKLEAGKVVTVKFDNKEKPSLKIKKIDTKTGEALTGATFKIWATEGETIIEKETDNNGEILLEYLDEGIYSVQEINPPTGYVLNDEIKNIKLEWSNTDNVKEIVFTNSKKPSLIITKHDMADGSLLPNAEFSITTKEGDIIWEGLTDENGQINLTDLDEGWYTITEMQPPLNYMFGDFISKDVHLTGDENVTVKFDNKLKPSLLIKKIDKVTGEALEGVTFKISHPDGKTVTEKMTDENGEILLEYIEEGVYKVQEIAVPNGYILDSEVKEITIEWTAEDTVKELIFENILKPTLVINKTSGLGGFGLAGAKFEVKYRQADGGLRTIGTYTTNSNGQIVLPYVNEGWYLVTEVKAPNGYQLPSNPTKEIYLSAGENSYREIDKPSEANEGNITVSNGGEGATYTPSSGEVNVIYGADIPEIAKLFTTTESVVYSSSLDFDNYPLNSIVIKKVDALTGQLLNGATFELIKVAEGVSGSQGTTIGNYTTDHTGVIVVTGLSSGHYIVRESKAPINYDMNVNNQQQAFLAEDGTSIVELMFSNYPYGRLIINKMDTDTKEPLQGATFEVTNSKGEYVGTAGKGHYSTDVEGSITIDNLPPDSYVVTEIKAPTNYAIDQENNVKVVQIGYGETKEVDFYNQAYSTLVIRKLDTDTKEMLSGAEFKVTTSTGEVVGNSNGIFTTDQDGLITITNLPVGSYIVTETKAPNNYILADSSQTVDVRGNTTHTLAFYNTKMSSAQILKIDSETKEPLKDAQFKVYKANGELVGTYTTDGDGLIILPHLENGWYKAIETKAPNGFILDDTAKDFEIKGNQFVKLVFENKKMTSLIIKKIAESDGSPLAGAKFKVEKQNGELVGEFTTDATGVITIPTLTPDWYVVRETQAPQGFLLDETPKTVEVKTNVPTVVTFSNKLKSGLQIIKIDSITGEPLSGAKFTVYKKTGDVVGEYTTDQNGVIIVDSLDNGWYKIAETSAPVGYQIDETPKDVEMKGDEFHKLVFANTPLGGLKIIKINSQTKEPIQGVEFEISKMNGEKILNETNGTKFVTDSTGQIYLPNLADGTYTVTETKEADGYFIDPSPKNVIVTAGKPTILEVPNTPASGLVILKTDEETGKPLSGVEFDILRADGSRVTANILDKNQPNTENNSPNQTVNGNGAVNGSYITDSNGRIYLNHLEIGVYDVVETKAKDGYILDTTVHRVTVREGKQETLKITNKQMSSILLRKVDADTGEGLMGARFILYNEKGTPIGEFLSDNEGWIHLDRELTEGKYFMEEVEAPQGYVKDPQRKTIYVQEGRTTNIVWENRMIGGQIQITKRSSDYNDVTKLPAGSLLQGATFEVYNTKNNVVDVFTTDYRGIGASKKLPTGVYFVKEIQAPQYYALNDKEMWVEISHDGDIVRLDVLNKSLYLDVNVRKQGPITINAGETITYHITDVQNNSNAPLTNFVIHDQIPVGALRVEEITTGTFNERVFYSIMYKTNKSGEYVTYKSNLSGKNSYTWSLHPNVLGLAQDEFVTDVKMEFNRVSQGFASLTSTQLKMYVLPDVSSGYEITNMATAGGYAGSTFEHAVSTWKTVVDKALPKNPLPRTGY